MKSNETVLIVFIQIQLTYVPICMSLLFKFTMFVKRIVSLQGLWHRVALAASSLIELRTYLQNCRNICTATNEESILKFTSS